MDLPSKPILVIVALVALAAGGWFGWQYFVASGSSPDATAVPAPAAKRPTLPVKPKALAPGAQPGPAGPAATAQPSAPANPDQLIDEVLTATGLAEQLNGLPAQMVAGVTQGFANQPQASRAFREEVQRIVAESYTAQGFQQRVREALKTSYDEKQLRAVLGAAATPVAKRMTQLELAQPSEAELSAYAASLLRNPLPAQREALLAQLDEASNASGLATEIALGSMRAMALGAAGSDPKQVAEIEQTIERQRPAVAANIRKGSVVPMAYTYRDASDAELTEYLKIYQSEHGKWFMSVVSAGMIAEFKHASGQFGEKLAALARSKAPAASSMARASERTVSDTAPGSDEGSLEPSQHAAARPLNRSKRNMDLRSCLELPTNVQIIKCAERGL